MTFQDDISLPAKIMKTDCPASYLAIFHQGLIGSPNQVH